MDVITWCPGLTSEDTAARAMCGSANVHNAHPQTFPKATGFPMTSTSPLITIRFVVSVTGLLKDQLNLERYWSHVPRVGDTVTLDDVQPPKPKKVWHVDWNDDGSVVVHLE